MAVAKLNDFREFLGKVNTEDPDRYELWHDSSVLALIPQKTSHHLHTYVYEYATEEQKRIALEAWKGRTLEVEEILLGKW